MSENNKSAIAGILKMKCPKCKEGNIFVNKHILPLGTCLRTVDSCPVCGHQIKKEASSAPGMNYALTVVAYILCFVLYALCFGITYVDYSIFYALATSTIIVILLQPWLMRISKVLYLYIVATWDL